MGKVYESIDDGLQGFIERQRMFFVATAPNRDGHVNLSPKGLDTFRVLGPRTVAYLDYTGSGAETIAHIRENGRITLLFCAFEGPPKILRLYGRGRVLVPRHDDFAAMRTLFPPVPPVRSIVCVDLDRISDSCGYGVPLYRFEGQRSQLVEWSEHKGEEGLLEYQRTRNATSIDGLPALPSAANDE